MTHLAAFPDPVCGFSGAALSEPAAAAIEGPAAVADGEAEPRRWTAARLELGQRMWADGESRDAIFHAINSLPGPAIGSPHAVSVLASRLGWRRRGVELAGRILRSRDGMPSIAEREVAELLLRDEYIEMTLAEVERWGAANRMARRRGESDAGFLARINGARLRWCVPRFRIMRCAAPLFSANLARQPPQGPAAERLSAGSIGRLLDAQ